MSNSEIMDAPDEGSLAVVNVPTLLARAWRNERSGLLQLAHGKNTRRLEIRRGEPVSIESDKAEDTFARYLEDTDQINSKDRLAVERMASERECPQASAILALKLLDPKTLYQAMRRDARNRIAETFEWQTGFYRWTDALPKQSPSSKPHDILALFQEQLPKRWGPNRLFESIMAVQDVYGDISPRYRKIAQKLGRAGSQAARAIARLDGNVPLGRVLGECAGDPLAAATLWTLLHSGVLRLTNGASRDAIETFSFEFDVAVNREVEATAAKGASANSTTADSAARQAKGDAEAKTLRSEIESLLGQLSKLDHYRALGLEEDAGPLHFKKAYFKAAKKYHPDTLARLGLGELKEPAARVFARIAEAFETLSDPDKKAAYDARGGQAPEFDATRLAQAETSFRKGEILVKMGSFGRALEYLEPAVTLWPSEPAYQAALGWALYKQPKADLERAAQHLEIALKQAPDDAVIHFRLGLVMRARGETNLAKELISKARSIEPTVDE